MIESNDNKVKAIQLWNRYWAEHDFEKLLDLFADEFIYEDVPTHTVSRTRKEFLAFAAGIVAASPDVRYEIKHAFVSGDRGSAEVVIRGTHLGELEGFPATGKTIEVRGSSVFEFKGDKIYRCSDYWCLATMLKQLGILP